MKYARHMHRIPGVRGGASSQNILVRNSFDSPTNMKRTDKNKKADGLQFFKTMPTD
jgi:hypothetical protein